MCECVHVCACMCDVFLCACVCTGEEPGANKRKVMCLLKKKEVLDKLHSGMSIAAVRCRYSVNSCSQVPLQCQ